jgi:hypothetical protein
VQSNYGGPTVVGESFSYFTILTYWGLAFYFLFASIHTFTYARHGTPALNRWPRLLQVLHSLFYTTIIVFPFLVTIVYWAYIYPGSWYPLRYDAWTNISQHAMNSLFALFEAFFTRTNPRPWMHLPFIILIMALYLGLAYLTKYTQGRYVYKFLNPSQGAGKTAGWILGIAAAIIIIFCIMKGLMWVRKLFTETKLGRTGKFHGGRPIGTGDVELEAVRMWEK